MLNTSHRIFSQQWKVSAETQVQAFALQVQFRKRWEDTLLPVFERVFDEQSTSDALLHIPKLEIKLKVSNDFKLWDNIPLELYNQLSAILKQSTSTPNNFNDGDKTLTRIPIEQHLFESLIFYLENGNLPWHSDFSGSGTKKNLTKTIQEHWTELIDYLHRIKPSQHFLFRLFQLLSVDEIERLSRDIGTHLSQSSERALQYLIKALLNSGESYFNLHIRTKLVVAILHASIDQPDANLIPVWMEVAKTILPPEKLVHFHYFISLATDSTKLSVPPQRKDSISGKQPEFLKKKGQEQVTPLRNNQFQSISSVEMAFDGQMPDGRWIRNNPVSTNGYHNRSETTEPLFDLPENYRQKEVRIKVQNAGLVLLHPFFESFFANSGIVVDKENKISAGSLSEAAALLHFLATGNEEIQEFELGFIKILLGMDPDQPLMVFKGLLTLRHKEEAKTLLRSVITHWSILKNSSPDGLRSSFLQRYALLYQSDEGWKMQMESKTFDVLLNQLPWSYSIVKLPWMDKPIFTEWITN